MATSHRILLLLGLAAACRSDTKSSSTAQGLGAFSPGIPISLASLTGGIPGAEAGQQLEWTGTTWALGAAIDDPKYRFYFSEEFPGGTACTTIGRFAGAATGSATCTYGGATNDVGTSPGVMFISTATTATGGARALTPDFVQFGTAPWVSRQLIKIVNTGSAVDQYLVRVGFQEASSNADSVDAVEAVYQFSANGLFWALTTSANSVRTTTVCNGSGGTTIAAVTANTKYELIESVNAAGTSATLTVNGVLCATNTTNIPTGVNRQTGLGWQVFNDTGSVPISQLFMFDYFEAQSSFFPAR